MSKMSKMSKKKLLSLIFPNFEIINTYERNNTIYDYLWIETTTEYFELPLDTLGRLCKEWSDNLGYQLNTSYYSVVMECAYCEIIDKTPHKIDNETMYACIASFGADTELEVIIKACTWVAKEKGLL